MGAEKDLREKVAFELGRLARMSSTMSVYMGGGVKPWRVGLKKNGYGHSRQTEQHRQEGKTEMMDL